MTNPVHLLSVAALLLVAFLVGAIAGTLARLIAMRLRRRPPATVAAPLEVAAAARPLVAAPVIAPLPAAPTPVPPPPAEVPVPDFAATMIALANEVPSAAFIEATKPRPEPAPATRPGDRPVPAPALAVGAMQPAHVAGETTSGVQVAAPLPEVPAPAVTPVEPGEQRTAEVILFPSAAAEPVAGRPSDIMVGGETVAVVDASVPGDPEPAPVAPETLPMVVEPGLDREPAAAVAHQDNFFFVGMTTAPRGDLVPAAQSNARAEAIPIPAIAANAAVGAMTAELPVPEVVETPAATIRPIETPAPAAPSAAEAEPAAIAGTEAADTSPVEPASEPAMNEPTPAATAVEAAEAATQPAAVPAPETADEQPAQAAVEPGPITVSLDEPMDEDAAMRAIEGNWTPRRTPPKRPLRPAAGPEGANQAVAASARAVIAARRTAEAVVAEVAEAKVEGGRPIGLDAPRDGRKDDLTHIIGVLPVIETALNTLGIYHFDQMGALTDENIGWIENHLGVPGRIGRELWREQARELSTVLKPRRAAEN